MILAFVCTLLLVIYLFAKGIAMYRINTHFYDEQIAAVKLSRADFDSVCSANPRLHAHGDSFTSYSYKVCLGAHWFSDGNVAVFVDDNGLIIYSRINITQDLTSCLDAGIKAFDKAVTKYQEC